MVPKHRTEDSLESSRNLGFSVLLPASEEIQKSIVLCIAFVRDLEQAERRREAHQIAELQRRLTREGQKAPCVLQTLHRCHHNMAVNRHFS